MRSVSIENCTITPIVVVLVAFIWMTCPVFSSKVTISPDTLKELTLTPKEKIAFDKFKGIVYKDLKYDFIKQDLYLLRWIRAKDLDVNRAVNDMRQFLVFIRENRIDTILEEDWSDITEDYPYAFNITVRQGRPVCCVNVGGDSWNIRRGVLQGKRARLMRFSYRLVFEAHHKLIEISKKEPNVTQFAILMNLDGFNPYQHSCPICVSTYMNLLTSYEKFFPGFAHDIIVINAPQAFVSMMEVLKPFNSKSTREALKIFGSNRKQWGPYLRQKIDPKLLSDVIEI